MTETASLESFACLLVTNRKGVQDRMRQNYAFIDQVLRPVEIYGKPPYHETHSIVHLDMHHAEFLMEFNTADDRPTQKIIAYRRPYASHTIHVAVVAEPEKEHAHYLGHAADD